MSLEQGSRLRNGKVIDSSVEENISENIIMAESNYNDSDVNEGPDFSSQLSEMKKNCEQKISQLQTEFSQLKFLMMAIIKNFNNEGPSTSAQGVSKQSQVRRDKHVHVYKFQQSTVQ